MPYTLKQSPKSLHWVLYCGAKYRASFVCGQTALAVLKVLLS